MKFHSIAVERAARWRVLGLVLFASFALVEAALIGAGEIQTAFTIVVGGAGIVLLAKNPPIFAALAGVSYLLVHLLASDLVIGFVGGRELMASETLGALLTVLLFFRALPHVFGAGLQCVRPLVGPISAMMASMAIGLILSPNLQPAIGAASHVVGVLTVLIFAIGTAGYPHALQTYWAAVQVAGTATAISALHDFSSARVPLAMRGGAIRSTGLFERANVASDVIFVAFPSFFARIISSSTTRAVGLIAVAGIAISGLGLFATFTRASIIGVLIFVGLQLSSAKSTGARRANRARRFAAVFVAVIAIAMGVVAVDEKTLQARMQDIPGLSSGGVADAAGSGRIGIWRAIVRGIADNGPIQWVIGNGMHASLDVTRRHLGSAFVAHNSYLELLHGQGVLGVAAYLWFIWACRRELILAARSGGDVGVLGVTQANLLIAFALSVEMFTSAVYAFVSRWYMFLLIGGVIGTAHARRESRARADEVSH